jgi:cell division protein FtsZ
MVDAKLEDNVWVTVIATGYGDGRVQRRQPARTEAGEGRSALREPIGEPRVSRARPRASGSPMELDVPEFIPRR